METFKINKKSLSTKSFSPRKDEDDKIKEIVLKEFEEINPNTEIIEYFFYIVDNTITDSDNKYVYGYDEDARYDMEKCDKFFNIDIARETINNVAEGEFNFSILFWINNKVVQLENATYTNDNKDQLIINE